MKTDGELFAEFLSGCEVIYELFETIVKALESDIGQEACYESQAVPPGRKCSCSCQSHSSHRNGK